VARADNNARANGQTTFRSPGNRILYRPFNLMAEKTAVGRIDAAVHESIAVGRRHDAMLGHGQKVALLDRDLWERVEALGPRPDEAIVMIYKV
jgi:hypothetical protein